MRESSLSIEANNNKSHHKKNPVSLRVWHWINMALISGSLITVLINSTLTSKESLNNVEAQLIHKNKTVAHADIFNINHELRDKVWDVHTYVGYFVVGFLVFRLLSEIFMSNKQKFLPKLKHAWVAWKANKKMMETGFHQLGIKIVYCIFYVVLITMSITGLSLAYDDDIALLKTIHKPVKQVHNFGMYMILGFLVLHIIGVIWAEINKDKGIVSDMIHGGDLTEN